MTTKREGVGEQRSFSEVVAREIVVGILENGSEPGGVLPPEHIMLGQLGVSRGTLREALRLLEVQGIIYLKAGPGGGPTVGTSTESGFGRMMALHLAFAGSTVGEVLDARVTLEPIMAGLAAARHSDPVLATMRSALQAQLPTSATPREYSNVAQPFHTAICRAPVNSALNLVAGALVHLYQTRVQEIHFPPETFDSVVDDHKKIAKAILAGHARKSEDLMRAHMERYAEYAQTQFPGLLSQVVRWE